MSHASANVLATIDRLVISCEHGGNDIPTPYRSYFADSMEILESHRGYDIGALDLARTLAQCFDAPLIASTTSRLLVDLNRSLHHQNVFSDVSNSLNLVERENIVREYYTPHRQRVISAVNDGVVKGHRVLHVGVHTFTPVLDNRVRTADIALLYDPHRAHERALCTKWCQVIKAGWPHYRLRRNYPYRGNSDGLTTTIRALFPPDCYLGVEIEVNQKWMMDGSVESEEIRSLFPETLAKILT